MKYLPASKITVNLSEDAGGGSRPIPLTTASHPPCGGKIFLLGKKRAYAGGKM
jgi:hypothetical protein